MVAVLARQVVEARRVQQHALQLLGEGIGVPVDQRAVQVDQAVATAGDLRETVDDLAAVQRRDLQIGDAQSPHDVLGVGLLRIVSGQIAGEVQKGPQGLGLGVQVAEHHRQIERGLHGAARLKQPVHLPHQARVSPTHHGRDGGVGRRVAPVGRTLAIVVEVVEHAPGVVHVHRAEAVAVVPLAHLGEVGGLAQVVGERAHLVFREAVALVVLGVEGSVHHQVVQIGEDGLLRDALHAREARERQGLAAVLQGRREPALEKRDHLVVVPVVPSRHDRRIVLVDEDDGAPPVVLEKQASEVDKRRLDVSVRCLPSRNAIEVRALLFVQLRAVGQIPMADVFPYDQLAQSTLSIFPALLLHRVEADVYDGIGTLVLAV